MKNLHIDSVLRWVTIVCYASIYAVGGFFAFRVLSVSKQESQITVEAIISSTPVPTQSLSPVPLASDAANKVTATPVVVRQTSTPAPTADNRCIITVSGAQYNVTGFRNIHSGGDIFVCNSDMTSTFFGQHSQRILEQMAQYRL